MEVLLCLQPDLGRCQAPPNIGMHTTADTEAVNFLQPPGAAGVLLVIRVEIKEACADEEAR